MLSLNDSSSMKKTGKFTGTIICRAGMENTVTFKSQGLNIPIA